MSESCVARPVGQALLCLGSDLWLISPLGKYSNYVIGGSK